MSTVLTDKATHFCKLLFFLDLNQRVAAVIVLVQTNQKLYLFSF